MGAAVGAGESQRAVFLLDLKPGLTRPFPSSPHNVSWLASLRFRHCGHHSRQPTATFVFNLNTTRIPSVLVVEPSQLTSIFKQKATIQHFSWMVAFVYLHFTYSLVTVSVLNAPTSDSVNNA